MDTDGPHQIYYEECGNPQGRPVLVLHGGPGGAVNPGMRRYFDPAKYRIILFDQRGCGKSRPNASLEDNTTWTLIEDIERLRAYPALGYQAPVEIPLEVIGAYRALKAAGYDGHALKA